MNKNILIRAVSMILAGGVLLTAYGCKDNKSESGLNQPVIENNQAVVEYTSTDSDGKEVDVTNVINIDENVVGQLYAGSPLSDSLKDDEDKDKFVSRNEDLGLDKDEAEQIVEEAAKWTKFSYSAYVVNSNSQRVAFRALRATNTEDIIIDTNLGCEYGFNPGKGMPIIIEGLVNSTKYKTEEEIIAALNEMDVAIIYTHVESDLDSIDDWSSVTTAYMPVTF